MKEESVDAFRILLDLQPSDDPIWTFFDSQHKHILAQMNKAYQAAVAAISCTVRIYIQLERYVPDGRSSVR
jgi:exocyst complex component 2